MGSCFHCSWSCQKEERAEALAGGWVSLQPQLSADGPDPAFWLSSMQYSLHSRGVTVFLAVWAYEHGAKLPPRTWGIAALLQQLL